MSPPARRAAPYAERADQARHVRRSTCSGQPIFHPAAQAPQGAGLKAIVSRCDLRLAGSARIRRHATRNETAIPRLKSIGVVSCPSLIRDLDGSYRVGDVSPKSSSSKTPSLEHNSIASGTLISR